jgi:hypothetical protein
VNGDGHRERQRPERGDAAALFEYVQAQMRALTEQASEMGQIMHRTAMERARQKDKFL